MAETYYSKEHEWITVDGETGTVGITGFAQEQLGDIVFVEVIKENEDVAKDEEVAVVESVKAASDIFFSGIWPHYWGKCITGGRPGNDQ